MEREQQLRASISKAFAGPGRIRVAPELHRSAITALGVHCLFVQSGFVVQESEDAKAATGGGFLSLLRKRGPQRGGYGPPEYWLTLLPSPEFIFRYTYPGKCGTFVCHCSVKVGTGQMFVHVSEEGNSNNIQFVGLLVTPLTPGLVEGLVQVAFTVPEKSKEKLKQMHSWDGVFGDLDLLIFNIDTYLIEPLLRKAMDDPDFGENNDKLTWNLNNGNQWLKFGALLLILGFLTTRLVQKRSI